jgi:predicted small secreted protein
MLALLIALTTSIAVITLAIRQNMLLTKENIELRRALRIAKKARSVDYYMPNNNFYYDPDVAKEDLWKTK